MSLKKYHYLSVENLTALWYKKYIFSTTFYILLIFSLLFIIFCNNHYYICIRKLTRMISYNRIMLFFLITRLLHKE